MRKTRFIVAVCTTVFIFATVGCARPQATTDYFAYTRESMEMTVRAKITRTASDGYGGEMSRVGESYTGKAWEVTATVTVSLPDERGVRATSVSFTSPPTLAGVTISRSYAEDAATGGYTPTVTVSRVLADGQILRVTDTEGTFDGLLRLADAWLPQGDVTDVSPVTDGARTVTVVAPDGGAAVFTFSENEKNPLRVRVTDPWGELELVRDAG